MTLIDDRPATRRRPARTATKSAPGTRSQRSATQRPATQRSATERSATERSASTESRRRSSRTARRPAPTTPSGVFTGLARVPFIVPIVLLVIAALGVTLYLSTKSAQDSYALESLRKQNQILTEQRNDLKRTADSGDSAPELADKAAKLGMIPATSAAHLVVGADGKGRLQGALTEAQGRRLGSLNPAPDPVSQIDASKVDDSGGLGGTPPPAAATPTPDTAVAAGNPPAAADGQNPAAAVPALPLPEAANPKPEPNVLPQGAATPRRNTATAR
ncbi:MAG: hypothetical protein WAW85_16065 [Gordonia sp. (in: high G+C Gram-positive bacteria)]|uniref:hypothetical protein n=1 Tax=Gordonia sp. (in: high G+C Gram-positive bacteria) TaxID=84139 RepID=UPI003BB69351